MEMSVEYSLQYGKGSIRFVPPPGTEVQLIEPRIHPAPSDQAAVVQQALDHPVNSPTLKELTAHVKKILIITNDNTRPMPSKITIPLIIGAFCRPVETYDLTILIATGLHRKMTPEETVEQFGRETVEKYRIVNHVATDRSQLTFHGKMTSGNELWLNRLVAESDLVISEGFIEAHFFAGFSGGRKSILPGVAGAETIMNNHSPANIADLRACSANLEGNPVHAECAEAAGIAGLGFILNVALNKEKKIIRAFAGHPTDAHLQGCAFVKEAMSVKVHPTDIVVTGNNGYPLDRNLYQVVKGIDVASRVVIKGGVIIMAAQCLDGAGHRKFGEMIQSCRSAEELNDRMSAPPGEIDKWQVQILARALMKCTIILINDTLTRQEVESLFLVYAADLDEALKIALGIKGENASISVIPEGPVVIPVVG
jgi:nickel-dependent lactate racemase